MGKFLSKIRPTINSGEALQAANTKVSRKVLYRRLQSPRLHRDKDYPPAADLVHQVAGFAIFGALLYIFHL